MTDLEKAIVKQMAHDFFDKDLALIVEAEEARIPAMYQGMVKIIVGALLPQFVASMDAKIDAFVAPEVGV